MPVLQRPYRGSRVASFYPVKSLPPISALDSAFQLQEYISLLIRLDVHDVDAIVAIPGKPAQKDQDESIDSPDTDPKKIDDADRKSDIAVDRACWIYEQLRRLAQDLSHPLITMLQQECTRSSCPQMKAGEWLYLCVAHGNDGAMEQCCAIDYILHTVDSATALLNSPRAFPSRLSIPQTSHRHFSSLARRLGRIFAHAYFHHREAFEQAEAESSLYARFLKLTNQFDLVPAEFLVIPESAIHHDDKIHEEVEPPRLFSAAVHPTQNIQIHKLTADIIPDGDQTSNNRPRPVDSAPSGTDSPRRLGRNRTDTMVFSEAYNATEELSKGEVAGSLPGSSPESEIPPSVSEQSWPDFQTRRDDMYDEDTGDDRSELTVTGPLSPPVEALSLISLEDTPSGVATSNEAIRHNIATGPSPPSDPATIEPSHEELTQVVVGASEESASASEPSAVEATEVIPQEAPTAIPEVVEPTETIARAAESVAEPVGEKGDDALSSQEGTEPCMESKSPPPPEPMLDLHEPPPSEPIPPESESDITDEVGELGGDEVRAGGEDLVG